MIKHVQFGGTTDEQTYLASLVLEGSKTATSSLTYFHDVRRATPTNIGDIWSILDGNNNEICQTIVESVNYQPFGSISSDFAIAEGDKSLDNWYQIHFNYYTYLLAQYNQKLTNETLLECVYFKKSAN